MSVVYIYNALESQVTLEETLITMFKYKNHINTKTK